MKLNEQGLWMLIEQRIRSMGLAADEANLQSFFVDVETPKQSKELGQDTVVLVNSELDIPYTAQVIIDSGNNKLETSKADYESQSYVRHQFFQDRITITTGNYGVYFTPYRLEFIRISPQKKNVETKVIHNS